MSFKVRMCVCALCQFQLGINEYKMNHRVALEWINGCKYTIRVLGNIGKNTKGQKQLCVAQMKQFLSIKLLKMPQKDEVTLEAHFASENGLSQR